MATIYIDNSPYEVKDGQNLLQACLSLGFNVPYFCWHPALQSVGACRQCAVKQYRDEKDTAGKIVMACMTPATDGTRITIDDPDSRAFRAQVIEWLMTNHPHDCPVCDEGGECHLQDMTVMSGHACREYRFTKRTYTNQNLGPFINHEMNRCIQCYRCVRYYRDYAQGGDFAAFASHNHVFFGRHEDGALESEFSGNLVEICPTGVFTDKTFRQHSSRPWDLQTAPSVCVHCGLGCNVTPGERYGELRRIRNRYNGEVNGYFLCDRGRFGYEFVNAESRVRQTLSRCPETGALKPISKEAALASLSVLQDPQAVVLGIASPRASLESNFALRRLVGPERFFLGVPQRGRQLLNTIVEALQSGPARVPSLRDVGEADAVFVLGEDLTNTAPLMALQVYQALYRAVLPEAEKAGIPAWNDAPVRELLQAKRGFLAVATPAETKMDAFAAKKYHAAPDALARLGFAVAHALDSAVPAPETSDAAVPELAQAIASALRGAKRPLIIAGPSCGSEAIVLAAANIASALCAVGVDAALSLTVPESNSMGLALLGGGSLDDAIKASAGGVDAIVVLENDLYRRADRASVDALLASAKTVIVLEHTLNETAQKAALVLPVATFAEGDGTLVNNEGRAQRFIQVMNPSETLQESWRWLGEIAGKPWENLDALLAELAAELPQFAPVTSLTPAASARFLGQRLPRQPHRYSGRTAMRANISLHEPKIAEDPDSLFTFSMEGFRGQVPASVIPSYNSPGWNSVQGLNKFQEEVGGALRGGDPGIRLIEPVPGAAPAYRGAAPAEAKPQGADRLIVALHHVFGSEELSALSGPVAARAPKAYLALNAADASALQLCAGDKAALSIGGVAVELPVEVSASVSAGMAGVPAGVAGIPAVQLPGWGTITKRTEG